MRKIITINKSSISIENYKKFENIEFERSLEVFDKVYHRVDLVMYKYEEENFKIIIPGGYSIDKLNMYFPGAEIRDNRYIDKKYKYNGFALNFPTRDELQNKAIRFLINKKIPNKFLCLETGGGKTYCSIHYVFKKKLIPITFVDQLDIAKQWKEKIIYFTTINEDEIYLISGSDSIKRLLKMSKEELDKYKWFIGIHRTFFLYEDEDELSKLFEKINIGIKLFDEAHVEMESMFKINRLYDCESVFITATPKRSNYLENIVYQNIFDKEYVPRFYGKRENYHIVIVYKYNTSPTITEEVEMVNKYGFDGNKWCSYILNNYTNSDNFIEHIKDSLRFTSGKVLKKTIVLFKTIELCNFMYEELKDFCEKELNGSLGIYHSGIKNKDDELEKDIIVTTDKSFGKAKDLEGLQVCINTVPCSSETTVTQIKGRLRFIPDKNVFFVDMVDVGFDKQVNQLNRKMNLYKKSSKKLLLIDKSKNK